MEDIPEADTVLDASGLICPEPLMLLHRSIVSLNGGEVLHITTTDPASRRDILNFCRHLGHHCLHQSDRLIDGNQHFEFWIKKKTR